MIARQQAPPTHAQRDDRSIIAIPGIPDDVTVSPLDLEHDRRLLELIASFSEDIAQLGRARSKSSCSAAAAIRARTRAMTSAVRPSRNATTSSIIAR